MPDNPIIQSLLQADSSSQVEILRRIITSGDPKKSAFDSLDIAYGLGYETTRTTHGERFLAGLVLVNLQLLLDAGQIPQKERDNSGWPDGYDLLAAEMVIYNAPFSKLSLLDQQAILHRIIDLITQEAVPLIPLLDLLSFFLARNSELYSETRASLGAYAQNLVRQSAAFLEDASKIKRRGQRMMTDDLGRALRLLRELRGGQRMLILGIAGYLTVPRSRLTALARAIERAEQINGSNEFLENDKYLKIYKILCRRRWLIF